MNIILINNHGPLHEQQPLHNYSQPIPSADRGWIYTRWIVLRRSKSPLFDLLIKSIKFFAINVKYYVYSGRHFRYLITPVLLISSKSLSWRWCCLFLVFLNDAWSFECKNPPTLEIDIFPSLSIVYSFEKM